MTEVRLNTSTRPHREGLVALRVRARLIDAAEEAVDPAWPSARLGLSDPRGVSSHGSARGSAHGDPEVDRGRQGINQLGARSGYHLHGNLMTYRARALTT